MHYENDPMIPEPVMADNYVAPEGVAKLISDDHPVTIDSYSPVKRYWQNTNWDTFVNTP